MSVFDFLDSSPRMSGLELVQWTRQLQVLISSGVPLVQALEILADQYRDGGAAGASAKQQAQLAEVMQAIVDRVSGGAFFWESLAAYPTIFSKLYVSLIRAGESSGSLDAMLKRLTRYLEDTERLMKLVRGAMIYPVAVMVIGSGVISILLIFVIPKFEAMLSSSGESLPLPTQWVIGASHFLGNNVLWLVSGALLLGYGLRQYLQSPEGREFKDTLAESLPVLGPLVAQSGIARFSRTLSTLLSSGVTLLEAMDICKATMDHAKLEDAVGTIRAAVESGRPLGATMGTISLFPKMASQMISVGESTGNLDKMLEKVADFYESLVEEKIAAATKLMEPLILVILGGTVGAIMIAMYLPIFKLAGGGGGS